MKKIILFSVLIVGLLMLAGCDKPLAGKATHSGTSEMAFNACVTSDCGAQQAMAERCFDRCGSAVNTRQEACKAQCDGDEGTGSSTDGSSTDQEEGADYQEGSGSDSYETPGMGSENYGEKGAGDSTGKGESGESQHSAFGGMPTGGVVAVDCHRECSDTAQAEMMECGVVTCFEEKVAFETCRNTCAESSQFTCTDADDDLFCLEGEYSGDQTGYLGGDCNDANANIHPTAVEICDGEDNDCDPATEEVCNDIVNCGSFGNACEVNEGCIDGACVGADARGDDQAPPGEDQAPPGDVPPPGDDEAPPGDEQRPPGDVPPPEDSQAPEGGSLAEINGCPEWADWAGCTYYGIMCNDSVGEPLFDTDPLRPDVQGVVQECPPGLACAGAWGGASCS